MKPLITILLVFESFFLSAQKQGNNWYFGDKAGITFNTSPISLIDSGQVAVGSGFHSEGCTSVSDSTGQLLFYSNGETIWDRFHSTMPNGSGILGHYSSTQSSIAIPLPSSSDLFYLFTTDDFFYSGLSNIKMRYSIVDMCLNGNRGDVVPSYKNILVHDSLTEKMAACKHSNNTDYWIVSHARNSNKYFSFLLTSAGLSDTVASTVSIAISAFVQGQIKFSKTGQKIAACATNVLEIASFDRLTGQVSNTFLLNNLGASAQSYGVEFSPDESKLYCTYFTTSPFGMYVAQYDLLAGGGDADSVNNSKQIVKQYLGGFSARGLQIGPDNRIYRPGINTGYVLDAILFPDLPGVLCGYTDSIINLGSNRADYTLPSFIAGYNYSNTVNSCESSTGVNQIENESIISIFPNPTNGIISLISRDWSHSHLSIYNVLGEQIYISEINSSKTEIDLSKYENGVYFMKIITEEETIPKRIIKQ